MAGPTGVYVEGLDAAKDNFKKLSYAGRARDRPRGAAHAGLGARQADEGGDLLDLHAAHRRDPPAARRHVRQEPQNYKLTGYVEEFAAPITGTSATPFAAHDPQAPQRRRQALGQRPAIDRVLLALPRIRHRPAPHAAHAIVPAHRQDREHRQGPSAPAQGRQALAGRRRRAAASSPARGCGRSSAATRPTPSSPSATTFLKLVDAAASAMPKK